MSLFIGNISDSVHREELEQMFKDFGECKVNIKGAYAFAEFEKEKEAETAMNKLQKKNLGGRELNIQWSKKSKNYNETKQWRNINSLDKIKCFSCGRYGHYARDCSHYRRSSRERSRRRSRDYSRDRHRRHSRRSRSPSRSYSPRSRRSSVSYNSRSDSYVRRRTRRRRTLSSSWSSRSYSNDYYKKVKNPNNNNRKDRNGGKFSPKKKGVQNVDIPPKDLKKQLEEQGHVNDNEQKNSSNNVEDLAIENNIPKNEIHNKSDNNWGENTNDNDDIKGNEKENAENEVDNKHADNKENSIDIENVEEIVNQSNQGDDYHSWTVEKLKTEWKNKGVAIPKGAKKANLVELMSMSK